MITIDNSLMCAPQFIFSGASHIRVEKKEKFLKNLADL
jgi:hypothetical protein